MKSRAIEVLRSPANPLLAQFGRALERGELTEDGCLAVEGKHLVEEALRSGAQVEAVLAAESARGLFERWPALANGRARRVVVPDRLFRRLAQTETPQGVAALVRLPDWNLEKILAGPHPAVAALAGLQDPGNLGTIVRALEAFDGSAAALLPRTVSPLNSKAVRASAGSIFRVPVFANVSAETLLKKCRARKLASLGLAPRGGRSLTDTDLRGGFVFFIGQEASGLAPELTEKMDGVVTIPIAGAVDSLNAAMAATLVLYEAARQRGARR